MVNQNDPDMLDEYDFSGGVRGKYAKSYSEAANLILETELKALQARDTDISIQLQADRAAVFESVAKVMACAQR